MDNNAGEHERCICNRLICIIKNNNIEIKCSRCKRIIIIETNGIKNIDYSN